MSALFRGSVPRTFPSQIARSPFTAWGRPLSTAPPAPLPSSSTSFPLRQNSNWGSNWPSHYSHVPWSSTPSYGSIDTASQGPLYRGTSIPEWRQPFSAPWTSSTPGSNQYRFPPNWASSASSSPEFRTSDGGLSAITVHDALPDYLFEGNEAARTLAAISQLPPLSPNQILQSRLRDTALQYSRYSTVPLSKEAFQAADVWAASRASTPTLHGMISTAPYQIGMEFDTYLERRRMFGRDWTDDTGTGRTGWTRKRP